MRVCVYIYIFFFFVGPSGRIERRKKSMVCCCIRRSLRLSTVKRSKESIGVGERRGLVRFSPLGFGRRVVLFGAKMVASSVLSSGYDTSRTTEARQKSCTVMDGNGQRRRKRRS